jgi:ATP synthase protein I
MSYAADVLREGVRRVLVGQAILTLVTGLGFFVALGSGAAVAAFYGGGVALVGTGLLARRVQRTPETLAPGLGSPQFALYAGVLPRYIAMLVLFALGIGALKLLPLPLIVAFAIAQLGFLISLTSILHHPNATRK